MRVTFTIPYAFLRAILTELRRQPYHVAVGDVGMHVWPTGDLELLARAFRFVHEGALRRTQEDRIPRFELGFVPCTLQRPDVWQAVAFGARMEGDLPAAPTCSILLGSGEDVGRFTGIFSARGQIVPVEAMKVVGAGISRLAAVDFAARPAHPVTAADAERWSRLIGALGGPDVWQRFTALRYGLIGTGRTGSLVAQTLSKSGVHALSLIDPDVLELHNLDAMDAVTADDLGRLKAEAIAAHLHHDAPHAQITALPYSVLTRQARQAIKTADVLICCVDDDVARLACGALAYCYTKPLLDIGTGIFTAAHLQSAVNPMPAARDLRQMGADVRLLLPGEGCLLCWGGVANPQEALAQWQADLAGAAMPTRPHRPWHAERAGSRRSLNAVAAHLGIRLLEDCLAGRLTQSVWLRLEIDAQGVPHLQPVSATPRTACPLCALLGRGDLVPL
jgi:hypothetical protein